MKTKLLKKIRARFKWQYLGKSDKIPIRDMWRVFDFKIHYIYKCDNPKKMDIEVGHYMLSNMTVAEEMSLEIIGIDYILKHRDRFQKRKFWKETKKYYNQPSA